MKNLDLTDDEVASLRAGDFILSRPAGSLGNFMRGTRCILSGNVLSISARHKATAPGEHFKVSKTVYDFEKEDQVDRAYWRAMAREEIPPRRDRLELKRIRLKAVDAGNTATHQGLVECAAKWLAGTKRCPVVVKELYSRCSEFPDAMGFQMTCGCGCAKMTSITVECKASRADFLNDRKKSHRHQVDLTAKGDFRFYLVGETVAVDAAELPEGWGLLRMQGDRVRVVRDAVRQDRTVESLREEASFMFAIIRRTMFEGPGFIVGRDAEARPEFSIVKSRSDLREAAST